jgi:hypothetical protein
MAIVALKPRTHRTHDQTMVSVRTAPGGADRHVHCACFDDEDGNGQTSAGANGHVHQVRGFDVMPAGPDGHRHDFSAQRCLRRHDRNCRHVD